MIGTTTATTILVVPVNPPLAPPSPVLGALEALTPFELLEAAVEALDTDTAPALVVGFAIDVDVRKTVEPRFEVVITTVFVEVEAGAGGVLVRVTTGGAGVGVCAGGGAGVGVCAGGGAGVGVCAGGAGAGAVVGVVVGAAGGGVGAAGGSVVVGAAVGVATGGTTGTTGTGGTTGRQVQFSAVHFYGLVCMYGGRRSLGVGE